MRTEMGCIVVQNSNCKMCVGIGAEYSTNNEGV